MFLADRMKYYASYILRGLNGVVNHPYLRFYILVAMVKASRKPNTYYHLAIKIDDKWCIEQEGITIILFSAFLKRNSFEDPLTPWSLLPASTVPILPLSLPVAVADLPKMPCPESRSNVHNCCNSVWLDCIPISNYKIRLDISVFPFHILHDCRDASDPSHRANRESGAASPSHGLENFHCQCHSVALSYASHVWLSRQTVFPSLGSGVTRVPPCIVRNRYWLFVFGGVARASNVCKEFARSLLDSLVVIYCTPPVKKGCCRIVSSWSCLYSYIV